MSSMPSFLVALDRALLRRPLTIVAGYFALQALLRIVLPVAPGYDDAAEFVRAQVLSPGYTGQPPFYTWLVWLAFQVAGSSLAAVVVLKNLLLFATVALVGRIARLAGAGERTTTTALLAMFLVVQFSWRSQFGLTHTIGAVVCAVLFVERFLVLVARRRLVDYVVLGVVFGLGCSSKYNFAVLPIAVLLAALTTPSGRAALVTPLSLIALAAAAAALAPHGLWALGHTGVAGSSAWQLGLAGGIAARIHGLEALAVKSAAVAGPLVAAHALLFWWWRRRDGERDRPAEAAAEMRAILGRGFAVAVAAIVVGMMASGMSRLEDHWLQTIVFVLPVLTTLALATRIPAAGLAWSRLTAPACMVAVLIGIPFANLSQPSSGAWRAAAVSMRVEVPDLKVAVSNDILISGRLKWAARDLTVLDTSLAHLALAAAGPAVLVWNAADAAAGTAPAEVLALARTRLGERTLGPVRTLTVRSWQAGRRDQKISFAPYR
jgi:4-amino-4-deoxy-L-arabinose transferase-like glycosyltransferase